MSILTTHVGSLPRPKKVSDLLFKRENNEVYEQEHFDEVISNGQSGLVFIKISILIFPQVMLIVLPISAFASTI